MQTLAFVCFHSSNTYHAIIERVLLLSMIITAHALMIVQVYFILLACSLNAEGIDDFPLMSFPFSPGSSPTPCSLTNMSSKPCLALQIHRHKSFCNETPVLSAGGKGVLNQRRGVLRSACLPWGVSQEKFRANNDTARQALQYLTNAHHHHGKQQGDFAIRTSLGSSFHLVAASEWGDPEACHSQLQSVSLFV